MSKTFAIQWMNLNGHWKTTPGPIYPSRAAALKTIKLLGLEGNPAYRIQQI